MADQTEAACLIATGAMYKRRLGLRSADGRTICAGCRPGGFSIFIDDSPFLHFDLEGRWQRAVIDGRHYLKGLDGQVVTIDRVREGEELVLHRLTRPNDEAVGLDASVRADVLALIDELNSDHWQPIYPPRPASPLSRPELAEMLARIARWDAAAWSRHSVRYHATYGSLPFLPPDAQQALVTQATLGHRDGRAFGGAEALDHTARTPVEFSAHLEDVRSLLGRRFDQCRVAFLAGSDALLQSPETVAADLTAIGHVFPLRLGPPLRDSEAEVEGPHQLQGVISFLDVFPTEGPGIADWRTFERLGLSRIALGIESGDAEVRALYGKGWSEDDLRLAVTRRKQAGIAASVLVLTGAGGVESAERHVDGTVRLLSSLELDRHDFIFLLDDEEIAGEHGRRLLQGQGRTPLSAEQGEEQRGRLKQALSESLASRRVKVLLYSLDKQWA
jgi:hypothetical protein